MEVVLHRFEPDETIPNNRLPLVLLKSAMSAGKARPDVVQETLRDNGWTGTWVYTVFDFWHYHTTGHEVLVCVAGNATLGLGGEGGIEARMMPGDAVIIPAGVGHRRLTGTEDFAVVGAYPPGQSGAVTRAGERPLAGAQREIDRLALPMRDPITGDSPGCLKAWM